MTKSCRLMSALCAAGFALAIGSAASAQDDKCQDAIAKTVRNVGNQEQKKNRKCVKDAAGENIDACVSTAAPKATDKGTKVHELFEAGGKCETVPALGVNNGGAPAGQDAVDAVIDSAGDILRGVFGDPVDGIAVGDKCLDAIAKRAGKAFDSGMKGFRKCVKGVAPLASQAALDTCVGTGVNDAKVAKFMDEKLPNDITKKCEVFPPAGTEDSTCAACTDGPTCAACVDTITRCEICEAANALSNGTADCDDLDNGLADASCSAPPPMACPIAEGRYTLTQDSGGQLQVASIDGGTPGGFPFPSGGTVVQDVAGATLPNCVHDTVVPASGGFSAPIFCIPGLNFSVQVTQDGCGIGQIDSNGGSDYTITQIGDTSDSSVTCNLPHMGCPPGPAVNGADASLRVDITVGDAAADVCGVGTANAITIIPVMTQTWLADDFSCPDADGVFDGADTDILLISQNLDFTTDVSTSSWSDIDGDGCSLAGAGPAAGFTRTGECLDIGAQTVTTVATGTIGSDGSPLFDLTFATRLPNTISGPAAFGGAVCGSPPVVNFGGSATRCIP